MLCYILLSALSILRTRPPSSAARTGRLAPVQLGVFLPCKPRRNVQAAVQHPALKFTIVIAAFTPRDPQLADLFCSPVNIPSLHIIGERDAMKRASAQLMAHFTVHTAIWHKQGTPLIDAAACAVTLPAAEGASPPCRVANRLPPALTGLACRRLCHVCVGHHACFCPADQCAVADAWRGLVCGPTYVLELCCEVLVR